jgi:hypothetical protein
MKLIQARKSLLLRAKTIGAAMRRKSTLFPWANLTKRMPTQTRLSMTIYPLKKGRNLSFPSLTRPLLSTCWLRMVRQAPSKRNSYLSARAWAFLTSKRRLHSCIWVSSTPTRNLKNKFNELMPAKTN